MSSGDLYTIEKFRFGVISLFAVCVCVCVRACVRACVCVCVFSYCYCSSHLWRHLWRHPHHCCRCCNSRTWLLSCILSVEFVPLSAVHFLNTRVAIIAITETPNHWIANPLLFPRSVPVCQTSIDGTPGDSRPEIIVNTSPVDHYDTWTQHSVFKALC